jgi:hypothetical protein
MIAKRALRCSAGFAPLLAACYTQRPLTTPVPLSATRIVAQVTDSGVIAMSNAIGAGAVEVEGVVAAADGNEWELQVVRVDYRGGRSVPWNGEQVRFPRYALTNATERTLNKRKSWLAAGVLTAGALLAARLFGAFGFGGSSDGELPPPN